MYPYSNHLNQTSTVPIVVLEYDRIPFVKTANGPMFPLPNQIQISAAMLRALNQSAPAQSLQIQKTFPVGRVLRVVTRREKESGKLGISLLGLSIPATLPENVKEGDKLRVKVVDNSESLVLKVIEDNEQAEEEFADLSSYIGSSLSEKQRRALRSVSIPLFEPPLSPNTDKTDSAINEHAAISQLEKANLLGRLNDKNAAQSVEATLEQLISHNIEDTIQQAITTLDSLRTQNSVDNTSNLGRVTKLIEVIEGQRLLNHLNPLMRALGEPSVVVLPLIDRDTLSSCHISFYPRESDRPESTPGLPPSDFESTDMTLKLTGLGDIAIKVAHNKSEILLRIFVADESAAELIRQHTPRLENIFKKSGKKISVSIRAEAVPPRPSGLWISQATKSQDPF